MQTLLDKNEAINKELKHLEAKIIALKNKPMPKVAEKKKKVTKKKSMFKSMRGMVGKDKLLGPSPKQIEAINNIHELLLKQAYEEVDLLLAQNRKLLFGKPKKGQTPPTAFDLKDEFGENILMKAIKEGFIDQSLEWIETKVVDINSVDNDGNTALMIASLFGELTVVEKLITLANKDAKTLFSKKTALHFAAEQEHDEIVNVLLDNGCSPMCEDSDGNKAYELVKDRDLRELLVEKMKSINPDVEIETKAEEKEEEEKKRTYSNDEDMRPLVEVHKKLLKKKQRLQLQLEDIKRKRSPRIDPNKLKLKPKNRALNDGVKQLHNLVIRGNDADAIEQVEELITEKTKNLKIDKDGPDDLGETVLMKAARLGFDEMLDLLLLYKCNTELKDESGYTALMKACNFGKEVCVEKLLQVGAEIDATSRKGKYTALMLAAERGHSDICDMLVKEGADHTMVNSNGDKAIDLVKNGDAKERLEKIISENPFTEQVVQI